MLFRSYEVFVSQNHGDVIFSAMEASMWEVEYNSIEFSCIDESLFELHQLHATHLLPAQLRQLNLTLPSCTSSQLHLNE